MSNRRDEGSSTGSGIAAGPSQWSRYPQSIQPEYYTAIGEICSRWAWLEFQLGVIAREAMRISKPEGFAVTGGMSMRTITKVLKALALADIPKGQAELVRDIAALAKELGNIGDMRNEYAHALWGHEKEGRWDLGVFKFDLGPDNIGLVWINKPLAEISNNADRLAELQARAQSITTRLKDALHGK